MYELNLDDLEIMVNLGCTRQERAQLQRVLFHITLFFEVAPQGMYSDELGDTICYHELENSLRQALTGKTFNLLEHLTHFACQHICTANPLISDIYISATKYLGEASGSRTFAIHKVVGSF